MRRGSRGRKRYYSTDISPRLDGKKVTVFGWVQDIRDLGGIKFLVLRDCKGNVQVTVHRDTADPAVTKTIDGLQRESVIRVHGLVKSMEKAPRGVEILPTEVDVLGPSKAPLPIDVTGRTPAELDTRLNERILDLRRPECQSIFRIRHVVTDAIRDFFFKRGYLEVHTPRIISSATEGGATLFPLVYYEKEAFLAQSPQLYKEQLITVFEKVFEVGPIFRAEKFNTARHLSESTSVDVEEAFALSDDMIRILEELIVYVIRSVKRRCSDELAILERELEIPKLPFERYTYDDALKELKGIGISVKWGEDLPTPALRALGKLHRGFYFITDWPTESKPFYMMPLEENPRICDAFDLMYGWIEIASGGTRIHSKELLVKMIKERGLSPESFDFHLKVFDFGMPPHSGFGLGLERLLMVLTGKKNIREVVLFPRDRARLVP